MTEISPTPAQTSDGSLLRTRLNRPWLIRIIGLLIGTAALSTWFALDAWVIYPKRGEKAIAFAELAYLQEAQNANLTPAAVDVLEPDAELASLNQLSKTPGGSLKAVETQRQVWLTQLSRLHALSAIAERNAQARQAWDAGAAAPAGPLTVFQDPRTRLATLSSELANASAPKPLSSFDMPTQYIGLALSLGGFILLLIFFLRIRSQSYTYEPGTMTLTLPDGFSFTPSQIETVDKRKWDKFIVFLTLAGESAERKIDLFRHAPLEDWILAMEKQHPNYDPDDDMNDDGDEDGGAEASGESAGSLPVA